MSELYHGDCLEIMAELPDHSVDLVLCDLPYGTTGCAWDVVIPFEPLWEHYHRIAKGKAPFVLMGNQPFTTALIASNLPEFRYEWIWHKVQPSGFPNANRRPLGAHENVCVFCRAQPTYHPQKSTGHPIRKRTQGGKTAEVYAGFQHVNRPSDDTRFPTTLLTISHGRSPNKRPVHPTQKPLALMEYMIRTYSDPGDVVLDNCMGSGTTGVAAIQLNRRFIGIEKDEKYFELAEARITALDFGPER